MAKFRVDFKLVGLANVRKHIGKEAVKRAVEDSVGEVLRGALKIEREAKKNAPVAFGDLRASLTHIITVIGKAFVVLVGTNRKQAKFVEFGTGPRGAQSSGQLTKSALEYMKATGYQWGGHGGWPPDDAILPWMKRKGIDEQHKLAIQRKIFARGTISQPFLFPAFEEFRHEIGDDVEKVIKRAIGEGR